MFLVMRSATLPLSTVNEYADSNVSQRISMVNGVAQVKVFGPQKYAVRIDVDPRKLSAHGIGIDEVVDRHTGVERQSAHRHDGRPRA